MNLTDTNEANPFRSDIDKYIYSILEKLASCYPSVSTNRLKTRVRFAVGDSEIAYVFSVKNSELENCMKENTLPKQIKDIL